MDKQFLPARINDTFNLCERTGVPHFLGFLTESEAALAEDVLKGTTARYEFFGGYSEAERRMLACLPEWCEEADYPISAFTLNFRECDSLSHRDFLGSLMALGITRESVGDILVEKGRAVIFVSRDVSDFVKTQLEKVGRVGVEVLRGFSEPLPQHGKLIQCSDTVASLRLDCVVSAVASVSRNAACEMIESGMVSIDSVTCEKATRTVEKGDRVTVRGKGKFFIDDVSELSKKGRIILKYSKYSS